MSVELSVSGGEGFDAYFEDDGVTLIQSDDVVGLSLDEAYALYEALEDYFHGTDEDDSDDEEESDDEEFDEDDLYFEED